VASPTRLPSTADRRSRDVRRHGVSDLRRLHRLAFDPHPLTQSITSSAASTAAWENAVTLVAVTVSIRQD
jgi:hypothetical protein